MMRRLGWMLVAWSALAACSASHGPTAGSQTHFLQTCDSSCAAPYDCICGVCTLKCGNTSQCRAHDEAARCTVAQSMDGTAQCSSDAPVCDVACELAADCKPLGSGYTCNAGRCRVAAGASVTDAGAAHGAGMGSADGATTTTDAGSGSALCDGSTDIRLGMWTRDVGDVLSDFHFMHPFGAYFAFIDGKCRYWASWDANRGIATGTLTSAEADQLVRDIGWSQIAAFSQHVDQGCTDAGPSLISNGMHTVSCTCGCDDNSPAGLADAEAAARTWVEKLGGYANHASTAALRATATEAHGTAPAAEVQAWPLSQTPISKVVVTDAELLTTQGVLFDAPADLAALRQLRTVAATLMLAADLAALVTDGGKQYLLYERDELPSDVDKAVRAFQKATESSQMP